MLAGRIVFLGWGNKSLLRVAYGDTLRWSAGARAAYHAIRGRAAFYHDDALPWRELVSALVVDTDPGESILGDVLRDTNIWPQANLKVTMIGGLPRPPGLPLTSFVQFSFQIEDRARKEGSRTVGERHIAQVLVDSTNSSDNPFAGLALPVRPVYAKVKLLEVGPDFTDDELKGWHGLVDTSVVLQSKADFWNVKWRAVAVTDKPTSVTLWLSTALLHELDEIPMYHRSDEVKFRARDFSRWLGKRLQKPDDMRGLALDDEVRLRFWTAPLSDAPPDSQHLEAAFALQDRRVPIIVVTHDNHMKVRAFAEGLQVVDLRDDMLK